MLVARDQLAGRQSRAGADDSAIGRILRAIPGRNTSSSIAGDLRLGTVSIQQGKKPRTATMQDVTIEGDTIRFTTTNKADKKFDWTLALNGDQLQVSRWRP